MHQYSHTHTEMHTPPSSSPVELVMFTVLQCWWWLKRIYPKKICSQFITHNPDWLKNSQNSELTIFMAVQLPLVEIIHVDFAAQQKELGCQRFSTHLQSIVIKCQSPLSALLILILWFFVQIISRQPRHRTLVFTATSSCCSSSLQTRLCHSRSRRRHPGVITPLTSFFSLLHCFPTAVSSIIYQQWLVASIYLLNQQWKFTARNWNLTVPLTL